MKKAVRWFLVMLCLALGLHAQAQHYANDFDNQYTWYPPWTNIHILADSSQVVTYCDSTIEYGLGISIAMPDSLIGQNLHFAFQADFRFPDTLGSGELVLSITRQDEGVFWQNYPLNTYANDSAAWFPVHFEINLPADRLSESTINFFVWNQEKSTIHIDNAVVDLTPWTMPSFLPETEILREMPSEDDFYLQGLDGTPLSYPIGMLNEYILDEDTIVEYYPFKSVDVEKDPLKGYHYIAVSDIDSTNLLLWHDHPVVFTNFHQSCQLLRHALVIPFIDSTLTVYRKNMAIDTTLFQPYYYLDHEGFQIGTGKRSVIAYHQEMISSIQLDAVNRIAYFNLDYWRDHPLIRYPLNDSIVDQFDDISCHHIHAGQSWTHFLTLSIGNEVKDLPRIMPIPKGYASGIIFTEHADWSDLRTHRATYFGSETITKAKDATGGFVFYGIPVTKSVFYNNPEGITNTVASKGAFTGLQATIKTDKEYYRFLRQLYDLGYEICLHTPEQYTTTRDNLDEALRFMQRKFKSASWIDHGYNNTSRNNREDLVCDGLKQDAECFAADLWRRYGIHYLWNAYYEENRMEQWDYDNNLTQPYPGFGDALPNRQVTSIAGYDYGKYSLDSPGFFMPQPTFLAWCTPSTLEATKDSDWDYYYSEERLLNLVNSHNVHITHIYPAWTVPHRSFWTYDADSTIVALPGMNRAFERIARLRDEHRLLPMTVQRYLDYYSGLRGVEYEILDDRHIKLTANKDLPGFTLLCTAPIRFDDNRFYEYRKEGNQYYVWFKLKAYEPVIIEIGSASRRDDIPVIETN